MLHEPLTGLPGRAIFLHRVDLALDRLRRRGSALAVLFLDLDRFKLLNDTLGHRVGDELLVATADRLRESVRRGDTVARLGGDEFAILCENVPDELEVARIAERIDAAPARPFTVGTSEFAARASIGVAVTSSGETLTEDLIADADTAMYRAKARPGARWVLFDHAMRSEDAAAPGRTRLRPRAGYCVARPAPAADFRKLLFSAPAGTGREPSATPAAAA